MGRDVWAHPDGSAHSIGGPVGCWGCANLGRTFTATCKACLALRKKKQRGPGVCTSCASKMFPRRPE